MSNKFFVIAKREYLTYVKSKGFIIATLLVPIFWLIIIIVPSLLTRYFFEKSEIKIALVDKTQTGIGQEVVSLDPQTFYLENLTESELNKKILDGSLEAYIAIDDESIKNNLVNIYVKGGSGIGYLSKIENIIGKTFRKHLLAQSGVDTALIKLIERDLKIETKKVTTEGIQKDYSTFYSIFGYISATLLFVLISLYGGIVIRGVVEEKANRIVEILLSSTKPFDIMLGKVLGLGSVGLTQILIWIVFLSVISLFSGQIISMFIPPQSTQIPMPNEPSNQYALQSKFVIPPIPTEFVIFFVVYFLLGYFLIASIYAGLGSAVDQEQDAQSLIAPFSLLFLIPVFFISLMVANPNGTMPTILSLFPPFTPVLMIARMTSGSVPAWQLLLSVILMLLSILIAVKISAKMYRTGILIYGKKPTFKEIIRWLRQA